MSVEDLADAFELLSEWEDRYAYISDLGSQLEHLDAVDKIEDNLVHGCMTRVWITGAPAGGGSPIMHYRADAEGPIIKGLVAMLLMIFRNKTAQEVLATNADELIDRLGLEEHLSPNRHVGMYAMVDKIKGIARDHV